MENCYRKEEYDNSITTIYTNDYYDIIDRFNKSNSSVEVEYKEKNSNLIMIKLLNDLIKTNHQLSNIITIINELTSKEIIDEETKNYIFECIGLVNLSKEKVKSYKS